MKRLRKSKGAEHTVYKKLPGIEYVFLLLPLYVTVTGVAGIFWLLLNSYTLMTVLPTSIILSAIATKLVLGSKIKKGGTEATSREINIIGILTIVGIIIWVGVNALYTAQNIFVHRDPAIYTVTGRLLVDNNSLQINIPEYLREMPYVEHESAGFGPDVYDENKLFAQGLHLLPALLGLSGRIAGEVVMLKTAPVIGGLALLAMYGFIRRFTKPRWAALGTLMLGLSLPMIYFSRDTYTEPLSVMLTFNALAFFTLALKSRGVGLWGISGLLLGAISMARADGLIVLAAAAACLVIFLIFAPRQQKAALAKKSLLLLGIAGSVVGLGLLDMSVLSSGYYSIHGKEVKQLLLVIALLLLSGLLLIVLSWKTSIFKRAEALLSRWMLPIAFCLIGGVVLFIASRPLWQISHDNSQAEVITSYIAGLQALNGDVVDPTRNYAEMTGNWLVWYMGFGIVLAAILGIFIATKRLLSKEDRTFLLPLILISGASIIFMVKVGITPDQIWAARRFLPVTFPGIIFFGVIALERCSNISSKIRDIKVGSLIVVPLALLICFELLRVTYPLAEVRVYGGQLKQIRSVCQRLEREKLVVWLGPDAWNGIQSVKSYCGVDAVSLREVTNKKLQAVEDYARNRSIQPTYIVTGYDYVKISPIVSKQLDFREVSRINFMTVPSALHHPPTKTIQNSRSILIAKR